jgi:hypothetical protein
MFDPAGLTLGQVSSTIRDFTVVGFLLASAWKLRGAYEFVKQFFERWTKHMTTMERGMNTLLTNHIHHIEKDLRTLAHRHVQAAVEEQIQAELVAPQESTATNSEI